MKSMKLAVELSQVVAAKLGFASCGICEYTLTDANMAELTDEERAEVGKIAYTDGGPTQVWDNKRLRLQGEAKWEHVLNALHERVAELRREAVKKAECEEEAILEALARPIEDWVHQGYGTFTARCPTSIQINEKDVRVQARLAEATPLAEARKRELAEANAYEKAQKAAEQKRVTDAKAATIAALTEMAKTDPELSRAALEGYPVAKAMLEKLALRCYERINGGEGVHVVLDDDAYDQKGQLVHVRAAPSKENFALYDTITALAALENLAINDGIGQWVVSPILSIDVCPHNYHAHLVTCVLCTLVTAIDTWEVIASLEDLDCNHEEDED